MRAYLAAGIVLGLLWLIDHLVAPRDFRAKSEEDS